MIVGAIASAQMAEGGRIAATKASASEHTRICFVFILSSGGFPMLANDPSSATGAGREVHLRSFVKKLEQHLQHLEVCPLTVCSFLLGHPTSQTQQPQVNQQP